MPAVEPDQQTTPPVSVTTDTAISSSNKSKKKKDKAAQPQAQATAESQEPVSPNPSRDERALSVTDEQSVDDGGEKKNQYIETLHKRLRTLKKKLLRIEQVEEILNQADGKDKLNEDQVSMVNKKPDVSIPIRELEDMIKQLSAVEVEDLRLQKQKRAELEQTHAQALYAATAATERRAHLLLLHTLQLFNLMHAMHTGFAHLADADAHSLSFLHRFILTSAIEPDAENEDKLTAIVDTLRKTEEGVDEPVNADQHLVSFARIKELLERRFGSELEEQAEGAVSGGGEEYQLQHGQMDGEVEMKGGEEHEVGQDPAGEDSEVNGQVEDDEDTLPQHVIIPSGGIRFMGTSELFDTPEEPPQPVHSHPSPDPPAHAFDHPPPLNAETYVDSAPPQQPPDAVSAPTTEHDQWESEPSNPPEPWQSTAEDQPADNPQPSSPQPQHQQHGYNNRPYRGAFRGHRGPNRGGPRGGGPGGFRGGHDENRPYRTDGYREGDGAQGQGQGQGYRSGRGGYRGSGGRGGQGNGPVQGGQGQGGQGGEYRGGGGVVGGHRADSSSSSSSRPHSRWGCGTRVVDEVMAGWILW
ncbi:hypothetical protein BC938DRAFT_471201 [Jimgerdemannia flammicorona]|uniref:Caprin-1 dimerization domain-containing protein n=1 Tax=Jimgerdemannia flammicorona TaxID=994334 RepID=A0A433Q8P0_9FUNG|nr:hypothetical protein BC938DRAFT_471201 [Jimgerdemannia flammicorona]